VRPSREMAQQIRDATRRHNDWFKESIPLIASENFMSPAAREVMNSDLHNRYAEGLPGKRYYQGNIYVDEIESACEDLAREVFACKFADVRPVSGTVANLAVLMALGKPGDKITAVGLSDGGHLSHAKMGAIGLRGMRTHNYPFDQKEMNIDPEGACRLIKEVKPKIALSGSPSTCSRRRSRSCEAVSRTSDAPSGMTPPMCSVSSLASGSRTLFGRGSMSCPEAPTRLFLVRNTE